jgi:hypothetical protein
MSIVPIGNPLPTSGLAPLAASVSLSKGNYITVAVTTGHGNVGTTTGYRIPVGILNPTDNVTAVSTAGKTVEQVDTRPFYGQPYSATSNDGFDIYDVCTPIYCAAASTPGKLSYASGLKRQLLGLCLGMDPLGTLTPIQWISPIAYRVAQSALVSDKMVVARDTFALTGNTTRTELTMPRAHAAPGTATRVRIMADGGFTAHDTNYWTITVAKRTSAAPGTAVTVAEKTLKITGGTGNLTAYAYADLDLSATVADRDFLEDASFTVTCTAQTTAAAIARLTVEVIAKVG